jgi:hypothetical protein
MDIGIGLGNWLLIQIDWTPSWLRSYQISFTATDVPSGPTPPVLSSLAIVCVPLSPYHHVI